MYSEPGSHMKENFTANQENFLRYLLSHRVHWRKLKCFKENIDEIFWGCLLLPVWNAVVNVGWKCYGLTNGCKKLGGTSMLLKKNISLWIFSLKYFNFFQVTRWESKYLKKFSWFTLKFSFIVGTRFRIQRFTPKNSMLW